MQHIKALARKGLRKQEIEEVIVTASKKGWNISDI